MAKTNEQFDQHFREKLDEHREKPSALAWERLESQLPQRSKPKLGIWWAVAASVTALLVAGYAFWPSGEPVSEGEFLADQTEITTENPNEDSPEVAEAFAETIKEEEKAASIEKNNTTTQPEQEQKPAQKTKPTPTPVQTQVSQNLIAEAENKTTEPENTKSPITAPLPPLQTEELEVTIPELKAPQIERTVAEANGSTEDEPLYRVSIYSNGIKKGEPADKNLITELGKTVGQVEGLLGKVDEGFAELQDRKDNLFAGGISIKKDRAER